VYDYASKKTIDIVKKVISHHQHLSKTVHNILCPRYKIVKLETIFKSSVGAHGFHKDMSTRNRIFIM
jgi:hypothetical protein